jgi:uncharacterized protein YdaU (DUF1376 family)
VRSPAFQFYPDDFIAGTYHMSDSEVGQYIRLLCHAWSLGGMTEEQMKKRIKSGKLSPKVLEKFPLCLDGARRNKRLETVRGTQEENRQRMRASGCKGAEMRWQGHSSAAIAENGSPSPSPTPIKVQPNNQRPTCEQVASKCDLSGWPKPEGERFWHHFESSGWIDKNGHRIVNWQSKLAIWITDAKARPAEQSHHAPHTNGANVVVLGKELERVIDRMKKIKATYGDHQSWAKADVEEFGRLKARRAELRQVLGVKV